MRRRGVLAAALTVALAACGIGGGSPSCPEAAPEPMPTPPWNDDPMLEGRIPDAVDGQPLDVQTYCASLHDEGGLNTAPEFLEAVGAVITDVTVARSAGPEIGGADNDTSVAAWRYAGADEAVLRDTFLAMYEAAMSEANLPSEVTETTMAGKTVHEHDFGVIYVADDTIYIVSGASCAEGVAGLP